RQQDQGLHVWSQAVGKVCALKVSRRRFLSIFPVAPSGIASTKTTSSGVHDNRRARAVVPGKDRGADEFVKHGGFFRDAGRGRCVRMEYMDDRKSK
ncbi:hypothetical protein AB4Z46_34945, partial [Variovorax sp. M-6]|uniref:hypothetical protein n=1 Tax=Variovorax sp. M-6 TaxID=3233041 RepID=UPI003F9B556F